ncbi:hypothetical protein [Fischerella thermalis]|uniref:hypothetical protein n=1 Tax=Fischerella thermalis TaxID=372787 RepID=UPI000C805112|nr:hypothetical protein [Fischerella thermalis]MBF1988073.1 hypothetical protein [Fischerella thermalis M58_A2018_009]MBF2059635.1 hypothetical protein [Fischerella thermalis M66_A2018_004]MBF2069294.1 hypothetical protein [Fischerella thermalis M48_A2018_028]PLZ89820.1 hypothetical protein CI593_10620 [Fischerella thermalis CCMEE 5194]
MKVTVQDAEIIKNIEPQQLKEYLQYHGWHEDRPFLDNATIWHKQAEKGEFEILLPITKSLGDYVPRVRELLATVADSENISHLEILSEFLKNYPHLKIQGFVTQIATPNADKLSGEVTIVCPVFEKLRQIKTELLDHDYILAIKSYQERLPIRCTGDLVKEDNIFILKNPREFQIENI